jgi:hypothetical protein
MGSTIKGCAQRFLSPTDRASDANPPFENVDAIDIAGWHFCPEAEFDDLASPAPLLAADRLAGHTLDDQPATSRWLRRDDLRTLIDSFHRPTSVTALGITGPWSRVVFAPLASS